MCCGSGSSVYSPGAPQSAHELLPGCCTSSISSLLFLSRLAIGEGGLCRSVRLTAESQQRSHVQVWSPCWLVHTLNAYRALCQVTVTSGCAFPLTSTASWSLLFCTQTLRSRNNRERKWNRRHWKRLIELQYQHDCTQPGSPASIKFDSFKQILFINQNAGWTWRHEAVTAQGSF